MGEIHTLGLDLKPVSRRARRVRGDRLEKQRNGLKTKRFFLRSLESKVNGRDIIMNLNKLSSEIIDSAITVHKELGPGLFESVYQSCMILELLNRKLKVESELPVPVFYRNVQVNDEGFRLDLLVEGSIIIEIKSVEKVKDVHKKQLLTYLRLAKKPLGLLINFNETVLVNGLTRIVNNL